MTDQYIPSLSHLVYEERQQAWALEHDAGAVDVLKTSKVAETYSPGKMLVDINKLIPQAKSKGELQKGASVIQLNGEQVRSLSTKKGPMLNYPQLENELKRIIGITTLLGNDYTLIMNKVSKLIMGQVLNLAQQNLDSAVANFYAIFKNFKITTLQKELTESSVVFYDNKNVDVHHTEDFMGGWYIVQLQSGVGNQLVQNYWVNDISNTIPNSPLGVQPYGRQQVLNILELCAKLTALDWNYQNKLQSNEVLTRLAEAKAELERIYESYRSPSMAEQAAKVMDVYKKTEMLEKMMSFSADVAEMSRPTVDAAIRICEQSIIRMTVFNTTGGSSAPTVVKM